MLCSGITKPLTHKTLQALARLGLPPPPTYSTATPARTPLPPVLEPSLVLDLLEACVRRAIPGMLTHAD